LPSTAFAVFIANDLGALRYVHRISNLSKNQQVFIARY